MSQETQESDIADQHDRYPPLPSHSITAVSIHDRPLPLRLPVTPYRLLNIVVLLGLGIPKAVYSAKGQSVTAGNLDWALGLFAAVMYARPSYVELAPTLIHSYACIALACMKPRRVCPGLSGSFARTYPGRHLTSSRPQLRMRGKTRSGFRGVCLLKPNSHTCDVQHEYGRDHNTILTGDLKDAESASAPTITIMAMFGTACIPLSANRIAETSTRLKQTLMGTKGRRMNITADIAWNIGDGALWRDGGEGDQGTRLGRRQWDEGERDGVSTEVNEMAYECISLA
ncbi:hypothetical protein FIBSPDRAFT_896695 [Athelia psychrophila]|uniref:Uncharacterized protein n=1 Tax=Athelia psychrophila TaxID=1759441 RepID=A0A166D4W9_9AGAM|nr:hypothetical protein FIBSPDRAFT_896695 [Fibularhizoctonia sp. CBS 109695]